MPELYLLSLLISIYLHVLLIYIYLHVLLYMPIYINVAYTFEVHYIPIILLVNHSDWQTTNCLGRTLVHLHSIHDLALLGDTQCDSNNIQRMRYIFCSLQSHFYYNNVFQLQCSFELSKTKKRIIATKSKQAAATTNKAKLTVAKKQQQ